MFVDMGKDIVIDIVTPGLIIRKLIFTENKAVYCQWGLGV